MRMPISLICVIRSFFKILSLFLAGEDALDVVEFVKGLDGREVVDVDGEDFVADLAQDGVVELEDGQLIARAAAGHVAQVLGDRLVVTAVGLELLEHLVGAFDNRRRHAC